MIFRFIAFGLIGIALEVAIKGCWKAITTKTLDFTGESSLTKFPLYGVISLFYPLIFYQIQGFDWYIRGGIYAAAFVAGEYLLMKLLSRFNLASLPNTKDMLFRAPLWFSLGFVIEYIYPFVQTASKHVL